ncbi:hypothetical protein [Halioxenophilus aromaticivorans]|uniref:Uncharacterized protein n=1 Tax=Halioxenophilus aromaticivorans TaxID=1306992 RepID=A0AAV3TXF2_9ALTE
MIEDWSELLSIFTENDVSLPDIELLHLSGREAIAGYERFGNFAGYISSEIPYYWPVTNQCEVSILFTDNPSVQFVAGEAEPFHLCFGGIKSLTGKKLPELGAFVFVFVFADSLVIDYRMGPEWTQAALEGLFEILLAITAKFQNYPIEHKINIKDNDGSIFKSHWDAYHNA